VKASALSDATYTHPSSTEAFNDVLGTIARVDAQVAGAGSVAAQPAG
jgi:hypothetical protein